MSEMIERVARAMAAADSGPEGSPLFHFHWQEFSEGYLDGARAAIEAMRGPTEDMKQAAQTTADPWCESWPLMIDAALK